MAKLKEHYANALLELSEKNGTLESDLEQGVLVRNALNSDDVQAFLEHTHIPDTEKQKLLQDAFLDKLPQHLMGFMNLMVHKNKESLIIPVLNEYINSINKSLGKLEAIVVSAKELTEKQIESIRIVLARQTGMQVEIISKVDPDVIGGFYILIDGHIFDGTVRTELNIMRESLKKGSYE